MKSERVILLIALTLLSLAASGYCEIKSGKLLNICSDERSIPEDPPTTIPITTPVNSLIISIPGSATVYQGPFTITS